MLGAVYVVALTYRIKPAFAWLKCEALLKEVKFMPQEKKTTSKREVIEPHKGDKRYVRRKEDGTFGKTVDVGRSQSADQRRTAKKKVPKGQGDRGDRIT
jgi:hypothetical protein